MMQILFPGNKGVFVLVVLVFVLGIGISGIRSKKMKTKELISTKNHYEMELQASNGNEIAGIQPVY